MVTHTYIVAITELYRFHICSRVFYNRAGDQGRNLYLIYLCNYICFIQFAITSCFTKQVFHINCTENSFPIPDMLGNPCYIALEHACTHIEIQSDEKGLTPHSS